MTTFEKEMFEKFMHEGTFVVNNVLKRNILKLKFMSMPEELKEETTKKEIPQAMTRNQKSAKTKGKKSQNIVGALTPRASLPTKSKFNVFSTAIQWMTSRPLTDNPDLVLAEKLV